MSYQKCCKAKAENDIQHQLKKGNQRFKGKCCSVTVIFLIYRTKLESGSAHAAGVFPPQLKDVFASASSVAMLPKQEEFDVVINREIKWDTFRSGGAADRSQQGGIRAPALLWKNQNTRRSGRNADECTSSTTNRKIRGAAHWPLLPLRQGIRKYNDDVL